MKKITYTLLSLFLFVTLFSGCAAVVQPPLFSSIVIPLKKGKIKIAIKKKVVQFTTVYNFFRNSSPLTNRRVAIYNCIGLGIINNINDTDVFIVSRKPIDKKIIYIHDFRNTVTWAVPDAAEITTDILFFLPGLLSGQLSNSSPTFNVVKFNADALIDGKNYAIKAFRLILIQNKVGK